MRPTTCPGKITATIGCSINLGVTHEYQNSKTAFIGLVLLISNVSHAGLITTTFRSNNGYAGNMFNLTTFGNSLLVTGSDINVNAAGIDALISVHTTVGGYTSFGSNAAA